MKFMTASWIFFPVDKAVFKNLSEILRNSGLCVAKSKHDRKGKYYDYTFVSRPLASYNVSGA